MDRDKLLKMAGAVSRDDDGAMDWHPCLTEGPGTYVCHLCDLK